MTRTTLSVLARQARVGHGANRARFLILSEVLVGVAAVRQAMARLFEVWRGKCGGRSLPPGRAEPTGGEGR